MSDKACKVWRIQNKNSILSYWGTYKAHESNNILASTGPWKIISAQEEDYLFIKFESQGKLLLTAVLRFVAPKLATYLGYIKRSMLYPIPGTTRDKL